ncbi:hypothetical protein Ddye_024700 [Dipteronia dyeriana]|uniref:Factor of DNA methylation 1-5/IDN2 domain-containing protein n=1 Tax=Dipteronia dyeriana TaxID=168575 RepID=A0AAD9TVK1_9ROSI|nr:hypothetical protein Ddye_024700 [Dipteronia dyeriana]
MIEHYDSKKFSGEIKKNLKICSLAMDVFEKKSEEREKQLQLPVEEHEKQLQLHEELKKSNLIDRIYMKPKEAELKKREHEKKLKHPEEARIKLDEKIKLDAQRKKAMEIRSSLKRKINDMNKEEMNAIVEYEHDYDSKKFYQETKKNLEMSLLAIEAFQKKSEEHEKQLQLQETQFEAERKRFITLQRMEENQVLIDMNDLKKKEEKIKAMEDLIKSLTVKQCKHDEELQDAYKVINSRLGEKKTRDIFGVKIMGELDRKPFLEAMKRKFQGEEAEEESIILWSCLRKCIKDPTWHPFKILVDMEGNCKEILLDVEDETLKFLKNEYGEEVCNAVTEALLEMKEYPRGRYIVPELWNHKGNKRATRKEVVKYLLNLRKGHEDFPNSENGSERKKEKEQIKVPEVGGHPTKLKTYVRRKWRK